MPQQLVNWLGFSQKGFCKYSLVNREQFGICYCNVVAAEIQLSFLVIVVQLCPKIVIFYTSVLLMDADFSITATMFTKKLKKSSPGDNNHW